MRKVAAALLAAMLLAAWPAAVSAGGRPEPGRGAGAECAGHGGGEML